MIEERDPAGVCSVCRKPVSLAEWKARAHPCPGHHLDCSWNALANPLNTPWRPGYRFGVSQASVNAKGGNHHMRTREYGVYFEIDPEGRLRWTGGVKATPATLERVEAAYHRQRPLMLFDEADLAFLADHFEFANDPQAQTILAKALAALGRA